MFAPNGKKKRSPHIISRNESRSPFFLFYLVLSCAGVKFERLNEDLQVRFGSPAGTVVGRLRVTGVSPTAPVRFTLHQSSDHHYFAIDPVKGILTTTKCAFWKKKTILFTIITGSRQCCLNRKIFLRDECDRGCRTIDRQANEKYRLIIKAATQNTAEYGRFEVHVLPANQRRFQPQFSLDRYR